MRSLLSLLRIGRKKHPTLLKTRKDKASFKIKDFDEVCEACYPMRRRDTCFLLKNQCTTRDTQSLLRIGNNYGKNSSFFRTSMQISSLRMDAKRVPSLFKSFLKKLVKISLIQQPVFQYLLKS
jgi:hypothetical protein